MEISFEGVIVGIIYYNSKNGYTVLELENDNEIITAVGFLPELKLFTNIRVKGTWTQHPSYGEQLKITSFERVKPRNDAEIIAFLGSGVIKGVGVKTAEKIVKRFGAEALDVVRNQSSRLSEIPGITASKALSIGAAYSEYVELEELMEFLMTYGIEPYVSNLIYEEMGKGALEEIKNNPYLLVLNEYGVSFNAADAIAKDLGYENDNLYRLMGGLEYTLLRDAEMGHTYLPVDTLKRRAQTILKVNAEQMEEALMEMMGLGKIIIDEEFGENAYLYFLYEAEYKAARNLFRIEKACLPLDVVQIEGMLEDYEIRNSFALAPKQKSAVLEMMQRGVSVITGGPGTGKTTVLKVIINICDRLGLSYVLGAPTGRAAKRMNEATGCEAETIHRLLGVKFNKDLNKREFLRNEYSPLEADVIIVDEVSMVDIELLESLTEAVNNGSRLVLVGDVDQLPSVGAGNVLKDIIKSEEFACTALEEVFRQAKESMIVVNAHKINNGEMPDLNVKDKDFFMIGEADPDVIADKIAELCATRLPKAYKYNPLTDIQVITPTRKGAIGVRSLNVVLQQALNPKTDSQGAVELREFEYREGDKVMQVKNNYDMPWTRALAGGYGGKMEEGQGVFNGDMGIIESIDKVGKMINVLFDDGKSIWYSFDQMEELEPAYAVTVHKSQGCEFPVIIMPMSEVHPFLMSRNLLYTAVTRAQKLVVLVGTCGPMEKMINNNRQVYRYSGLEKRLKACFYEAAYEYGL